MRTLFEFLGGLAIMIIVVAAMAYFVAKLIYKIENTPQKPN